MFGFISSFSLSLHFFLPFYERVSWIAEYFVLFWCTRSYIPYFSFFSLLLCMFSNIQISFFESFYTFNFFFIEGKIVCLWPKSHTAHIHTRRILVFDEWLWLVILNSEIMAMCLHEDSIVSHQDLNKWF